jgi:cysteine-rich secretory family protein
MQRRTASVALAVFIALGGLLVAPTSAQASSEESRFTSLTNHERSSRGLRTLRVTSDLVAIARRHSQQMASRGDIYHNDNLENEVGGNWTELGENVGKGPSVDSIHNAFMDSAPHRANILRSSFNQVGIGTAIKNGYIYVTEVFAKRGSTPRTVVHRAPPRPRPQVAHRAPPPPKPKPKPRPAQPIEAPRTVSVLVRLIGLDADRVSPITGEALGI